MMKAKQFMDGLKGDVTIDVLGLSRAMEGISDILFPATSTLHKKIRYQIFIPSIMLHLYHHKPLKSDADGLRKLEYQLQRTLIASGEEYSVFGSTKGDALKYWPSQIYWSSLNKLQLWGQSPIGLHEMLEMIEERHSASIVSDDGEVESELPTIEFAEELHEIYGKIFPKGQMAKKIGFALEKSEARFLKQQFIELFPNSLTSHILQDGNKACCDDDFMGLNCPSSPPLENLLKQAKAFSRVAMGATYAYRWALSTMKEFEEAKQNNLNNFETWVGSNQRKLDSWEYPDLIKASAQFQQINNDRDTEAFIKNFLAAAFSTKPIASRLADLSPLVQKREESIKGRNRTHFNNEGMRLPQNILGNEKYCDYLFDFRWRVGSDNLKDIFNGLRHR
jgi:hypothetical protein